MRITLLVIASILLVSSAAHADRWHRWHRWHHWDRWHHWVETDVPDTFGAIAYSPSTGRVGASSGRLTGDNAQVAAVASCGVADCTASVTEQGQVAVLVRGTGGAFAAWNDDLVTAEQAALGACGAKGTDCRVVTWVRD